MSGPQSSPTPRGRDSAVHTGLPVQGYRPQHGDAVAAVNANKAREERLLRVLDACQGDAAIDQRWLAVARTHFEQGFMALNRAVFRPSRIALPEDDDGA
jgi:hypothetical protein